MDAKQRQYIGVDAAKEMLEVRTALDNPSRQVPNEPQALEAFVKELQKIPGATVIVEATGIYHQLLVGLCARHNIDIAVVNPANARFFAKATGQLAKTDKIDAAVLIRFAMAVPPEIRKFPGEEQQTLSALVNRRQQLVSIQVAETTRLQQAPKTVRPRIEKHLKWIAEELQSLDEEMTKLIQDTPAIQQQQELLMSVPGVGEQISRVLLSQLCELGQCDRKAIAALVGLAPFANDSGKYRGQRTVFGGRAQVRSKLYMAALVAVRHEPVFRTMYERLLAAGKAKKLALVAVARKILTVLNAILHTKTPWNPSLAAAH